MKRRERASTGHAEGVQRRTEIHPYYFPSMAQFPFELSADIPRLPYKTRRGQIKSAIHWGQRKLLLSEVQLLTEAGGVWAGHEVPQCTRRSCPW